MMVFRYEGGQVTCVRLSLVPMGLREENYKRVGKHHLLLTYLNRRGQNGAASAKKGDAGCNIGRYFRCLAAARWRGDVGESARSIQAA